ncbi:hypothetical protein GALMADRAFT_245547 [Galerina marginata CBS 339.88]|uniref:Uncharacterized protein n=1 Tax=Galerina marginata (strain CBS 339.88) TaxID=685588 RepID=A0A067T5C9_GALM3|nr:hypothetical protein GALMADRAFT_245547 [Galerina marginata CBS 339.88]
MPSQFAALSPGTQIVVLDRRRPRGRRPAEGCRSLSCMSVLHCLPFLLVRLHAELIAPWCSLAATNKDSAPRPRNNRGQVESMSL